MPAAFRDEETEDPTSDATQPHTDEKRPPSTSGATSSDSESNTSITIDDGKMGTSVAHSSASDAKSRSSAISRDEETGFPTIYADDLDFDSKTAYSYDDDGSSTTTSEDSDADNDGTYPTGSDRPPPYDPLGLLEPPKKDPPAFEADPVRYILGMKLPIADSGYCACNHLTSTYGTAFFMICYASLLIADAYAEITPVIRTAYSYKFHLFLSKEQQYAIHGWSGMLMIISAIVLIVGTYRRSRPTLMVWLLVMLAYVVLSLVLWLLGLLLSFAADGWNTHSTTASSLGFLDVGLEFYLLHMVYSYNRYMHDEAPQIYIWDPQTQAKREMELARVGLREINIMGIPITAPIDLEDDLPCRPGQQVTSV